MHLADISYAVRSGDYDIRASHISHDELGELTEAFNGMLNEIQDSKINLEKKVKKRTADMEKAMKVKSDFLSNMSHEIRTPIHGIMNYAEFLVHDWTKLAEEKRFDFVKKLYINSDRLLSLINNLLDLSKLDANKMDFHFKECDLGELLKNAIEEVEPLYIAKNLKVYYHGDEKQKFIASFDKERILQVIRNLFSNAIKFTKDGIIIAEIKFTEFTTVQDDKVKGLVLSIKDEGLGIPEKELKYIFDKFNQSAHTRTGAGGTGLGLAICKDIISAHHGILWAENNINEKGATFSFALPLMQHKKKKTKS
jgi:two-component system sensor histidine kinase ChiS